VEQKNVPMKNLSGTLRISVYNERISDGQNGNVGLKALGIHF